MAATFPGGVWAGYTVVDLVSYWNAATANPISEEIRAIETFLITARADSVLLIGPASGGPTVPTWRALALGDVPYTARGTILRGGATAYEELAAETILQVLIGDGTDLTSRTLVGSDVPIATDTARGTIEIASDAETAAGAANTRAITPAKLRFDVPLVPAALKGVRLDANGDLILPGEINVADGESIGIDSANERVEFYTAGYVAVMGADLGINTVSPSGALEVATARGVTGIIVTDTQDSDNIRADLSVNAAGYGELVLYSTAETARVKLTGSADCFINAGNVGIGTDTDAPTANDGKVLYFGDNAANPTMVAGTAGFYNNGGEAYAVDGASNQIQLTPHNYDGPVQPIPDTLHWSGYHRNPYMGVEKWYDIERALLALEASTGETFIHTRQLPASERRNWGQEQRKQQRAAFARGEKYTMKPKPVGL